MLNIFIYIHTNTYVGVYADRQKDESSFHTNWPTGLYKTEQM